jgi:hypothetical protein
MRPHEHPDNLTPDQRFQNIAGVLAVGLRRLRPRTASLASPAKQSGAKNLSELSPDNLEFSAETRLTVQTG